MAGYTSSSRTKDVKIPPTIGAAIRFITSEPAPVAHMMGNRPTQVVAKVMNFGRRRFAAVSYTHLLGDRQTGKTAIAIDTILNQRGQNVLCVYCAIGQRASAVAKAVATLREKGAMEYTVLVVTEGNDPPGLAYIAPYAATSIAESRCV